MSTFSRHRSAPPPEAPDLPRTPEDGDGAGAPVVCRFLRTKLAFGSPEPGAPDWQAGDDTTAVYWCLQTMETAGPDDVFAHAHTCRRGRACFEPREG